MAYKAKALKTESRVDKLRRDRLHAEMKCWGTPEKCYADSGFWKWIQYARTKDEHDPNRPVKNFPLGKEYVQLTFLMMLGCPVLGIAKSRQIMVSWMMAAFACWEAWRRPHSLILYQTKKESDAFSMVSTGDKDKFGGRMSFIVNNLPDWLGDPLIKAGGGNRVGELIHMESSRILAVPQGENQVRGHTPTKMFCDEAAFQEEFEPTYYAIQPAIIGGGRLTMASTANASFFWDLIDPLDDDEREVPDQYKWLDRVKIPKGCQVYFSKYDIPVLKIHYSADPDKDPDRDAGRAWVQAASKLYPGGIASPGWQREMEMRADVADGSPVFPSLADPTCPVFVHRLDQRLVEKMDLYAGFDYGTRNPSAWIVWGVDRKGRLWAVHEVYKPCTDYRALVQEIKSYRFYDKVKYTVADPSILSQKTQHGADGQLHTMSEMFADACLPLNSERKAQDVPVAVKLLADFGWGDLKGVKAFITSDCPNLAREVRGAMWEKIVSSAVVTRRNDPEKIRQKNNHAIDATALVLDTRPEFKVRRKPEND